MEANRAAVLFRLILGIAAVSAVSLCAWAANESSLEYDMLLGTWQAANGSVAECSQFDVTGTSLTDLIFQGYGGSASTDLVWIPTPLTLYAQSADPSGAAVATWTLDDGGSHRIGVMRFVGTSLQLEVFTCPAEAAAQVGAYSVGLFHLSEESPASAPSVHWSGSRDAEISTSDGNDKFYIDFDADGNDDALLIGFASGGRRFLRLAPSWLPEAEFEYVGEGTLVRRLAGGQSIGSMCSFDNHDPAYIYRNYDYEWAPGVSGYLGCSFVGGDGMTHYAWIHVSIAADGLSAIVHEWAYAGTEESLKAGEY